MAELTTRNELPLVEQWRQIARAAALGEHDFDAASATVNSTTGSSTP